MGKTTEKRKPNVLQPSEKEGMEGMKSTTATRRKSEE
jgi:hypothetical protein